VGSVPVIQSVVRCVTKYVVAQPAPPHEDRERREEPPLDRVEEVADRGEPRRGRELVELCPLESIDAGVGAIGALRDGVRTVEVTAHVVERVGDPQLRKHVVGRVIVDRSRPLGGLEPAGELGRPSRGGWNVFG
jgi:hypothetical protein